MMTEAMIWIGALLLVVGVIFMLVHEQRRRATMTEEEYEEQARGQVSLLGSTGLALDQILRPQSKRCGASGRSSRSFPSIRSPYAMLPGRPSR